MISHIFSRNRTKKITGKSIYMNFPRHLIIYIQGFGMTADHQTGNRSIFAGTLPLPMNLIKKSTVFRKTVNSLLKLVVNEQAAVGCTDLNRPAYHLALGKRQRNNLLSRHNISQ